jgi:GH25 family lysozyme M1 (1,4-beta-N-acetylmuramidase)
LKFAGLAILLVPGPVALAQRPLGIDVSDYQTSVTWSSVKAAGISFAWSKADEGGGGTQSTFAGNQVNGKAAGVYMGAYHYSHPELNTASTEATHFWTVAGPYIKGDGKTLMPMIDVEASAFNGNVGASSLSAWINQWVTAVSNSAYATGIIIRPMVYVSACNANHFDTTIRSTTYPWIADYNGADPQTSTPWTVCNSSSYEVWGSGVWTVWQYTSSGGISGVSSANVDHDVFNGTAAALVSTLVIGGAGNAATLASSSVPSGVLPGHAFTATITMNNSGGTAWTNSGATPYQLGSQSTQDNMTWGLNRVNLPASPISPGANATFTINATAPTTPGTYTFAWRMIQGTTAFGDTFSTTISVGVNNATVVSSSVPSSLSTGQTFTASITLKNNGGSIWTNTGANPYKLGSQTPQDNTIWGLSRVALPSSPINLSSNVTFSFTGTAPASGGTYTFAWKMLQEGVQWFGDTYTKSITVTVPGTSGGTWWRDSDITPTSFGNTWATSTDCGTYWYIYSHFSSCAARGYTMTFNPGFQWNGRGFIHMDWVNGGAKADTWVTMRYLNQTGSQSGSTSAWNDCAHTCSWQPALDLEAPDVYQYNGLYRAADEDTTATCGSVCGSAPSAGREIHMYGDKWVYLNDWVTFGGFSSGAGVSDLNWSPPFGESGIYVYGAVDTSHGNYFANNLYGGKAPYRVQTGDCGADTTPGSATYPNFLNFKGNAGANGNNNCDNCNGYAFAWVQAPSAAGPQWGVGSDDGNRIWLNGTMIADNNIARGMTWDQDRFLPVGMSAGWNRVLFKVHNGGGGFSGVVSLHSGADFHQVEPNLLMQPDRYGGFSLGPEQDDWYPQIVVNSIYGWASPTNATVLYGNNTTVAAIGSSTGQGPVPYWRTMQYQWGYGLGNQDANYADVSGTATATNWSHSVTGVTGHRRLYFFAVSQSGRTSFQNSGTIGGSRFQDAGNYGRYYDLYVDNVAPQNPSFSSATATGTTQINLAWPLPLDQGVNIGAGSTESAGGAGNQDAQNWYRAGGVGVQVYRNGEIVPGGAWSTATTLSDTSLTANTAYTYTLEARDNNGGVRGAWHNSTGPQGSNTVWTLSVAPAAGSATPNSSSPHAGDNVIWTAAGGFGPGLVQYYRYAWDTAPTHTWSGAEPQWSSGTITTVPATSGNWYLHVKGYNGADVENGTFDYSVAVVESNTATCSQTNVLMGISANVDGTFTLTFQGTPQAAYYVVANTNLFGGTWAPVSDSTNTVTDNNGLWQITVSNTALQQFYRSVALTPCP